MTGSRIRAARLAAGISLREVARRAHVDAGYLSQVERGLRSATPGMLAALSEVLGVELSQPAPLRAALELLTSDVPTADIAGESAVHDLRLLDDRVGGVDSYPIVVETLTRIGDPAVYAELAQLAGWVAADAGRHDAARRHYLQGVKAATESGNRVAAVNCLSSLAYMLAGSGDAVLLARAATRVRDQPATMVCLAAERLAWTLAKVGDADGCLRALDAADDAWTRRADGAEPQATYWLSAPEIEIMRGRCYVELRKPLRAVPLLERVTAEYSWSTRENALYLTYLADAYEQANEHDAARDALQRARELAAQIHSVRLDERISS